jgi:hypothetical protein
MKVPIGEFALADLDAPVLPAWISSMPVDYRIAARRLFRNTAFSREKRQSLKTACKCGRKV